MGWLNEDGDWVVSERDEDDTHRRQHAAEYMKAGAGRVDRPIDHAVGQETNPTRKAARQAFELNRAGVDPKHLATMFALHRHGSDGDPTDAAAAAATNREAVDQLASRYDDEVQARYEHDDALEDENAWDWLYETQGLTADDLSAKVAALSEDEGRAVLKMFGDQYAEARANGYGGPDAGDYGDDDSGDYDYADDGADFDGGDSHDGEYDDDTGYDPDDDAGYATGETADYGAG